MWMCSTLCTAVIRGKDVNCVTKCGDSGLTWASNNGHLEMVRLLFTNGAKVDHLNNNNSSAVWNAACTGRTEVLAFLLENGGKGNVDTKRTDGDEYTPLIAACRNGHAPAAKLLLQYGASPLLANKKLQTPLHLACQKGHSDCVMALLAYSAKFGAIDGIGKHALKHAQDNAEKNKEVLAAMEAAATRAPAAAFLHKELQLTDLAWDAATLDALSSSGFTSKESLQDMDREEIMEELGDAGVADTAASRITSRVLGEDHLSAATPEEKFEHTKGVVKALLTKELNSVELADDSDLVEAMASASLVSVASLQALGDKKAVKTKLKEIGIKASAAVRIAQQATTAPATPPDAPGTDEGADATSGGF